MSKPSFSNIDLWLFEYAEGNLSPEQASQLELFILEHPELDIDRDMWEMSKVNITPVAYPEQEKLYKRKPVYGYFGAGVTAMSLILLISGYFWLNDSQLVHETNEINASHELGSTTFSQANSIETDLRTEISDLKNLVASLEEQMNVERGNSFHVTQVRANLTTPQSATINANNRSESAGLELSNVASNNSESISNTNTSANSSFNQGVNIFSPTVEPVSPLVMELNNGNQEETSTLSNSQSNLTELLSEITEENRIDPIAWQDMSATESQSFYSTRIDKNSSYNNSGFSSNYQDAFKYKFSKAMRSLQRMMDNPIALKNFRDPFYHVPGTITNDLNFGATGTVIAPRVQTMSRLQWEGTDQEMFSNEIAVDGYSYRLCGGIGLQVAHDFYNNGGIQRSQVAMTYSPKISVNRKISVEPAVRFKIGNKLLNASRMEGQSQVEMMAGNVIDYYTDGTSPVGRKLWYKDLGLGLNVNTEWFYASAQFDNIFQHRDNMYSANTENKRRAGTHFVATIGTDWESKKSSWETQRGDFGLSPYLVYQKFENINELWAGANFRCYWFTIGGAISSNLDPAASLGVKFKNFSLMYNADYLHSGISENRSLSHQLTLRITGKPNRMGQRFLNQ